MTALLFLLTLATCDGSLWGHTYHPERLLVKSACVSVTGTIVDATHGKHRDGVRHEADGDCHGWLKLDPGQEQFLNAGNMSDEGGNLVFLRSFACSACLSLTLKLPARGLRAMSS